MSKSRQWLIDASLSDEVLTFVPYDELTADIMIGLTVIGNIPDGDKLIGVCHPDGDEAANAWVEANQTRINVFKESHEAT